MVMKVALMLNIISRRHGINLRQGRSVGAHHQPGYTQADENQGDDFWYLILSSGCVHKIKCAMMPNGPSSPTAGGGSGGAERKL